MNLGDTIPVSLHFSVSVQSWRPSRAIDDAFRSREKRTNCQPSTANRQLSTAFAATPSANNLAMRAGAFHPRHSPLCCMSCELCGRNSPHASRFVAAAVSQGRRASGAIAGRLALAQPGLDAAGPAGV
jgi:hypothetical protein